MKRTLAAGALTTAAAAALLTGTAADAVSSTGLPGSGWTAAIQHQTSADDDRGRLVMVRPQGGIVDVGEVSDDAYIKDVSYDGRHVITSRVQDGQTRATVWDTHTGTPRYFRTSEHAPLQFGGGGIVQLPRNSQRTFTVRNLDGTVRKTYSAQPLPPGRSYVSAVVSPDGASVVEVGTSVVVRDAATGKVRQRIASPETQTEARDCSVDRAWGAEAVSVRCGSTEELDVQNVYRVPFTGKTTRVVENFSTVWPVSTGVIYNRNEQTISDWMLEKSGSITRLPTLEGTDVVGSEGDRVFVMSDRYGGTDGTLFTYDVSTGERTTLAGTEETGGGVISDAQPIDGLQ